MEDPRHREVTLAASPATGKEADRLVTRIAPGAVSLVAELRENGANSVFLAEHGETQWRRRLGR